ncbi:hypothetical protein GCM10022393_23270 [Aquimarina addita]|uniref:NarX-like N-terminal domain-containing protein n=1 Tax=Aquimarina addita TaxID=870485 RepID=A0ABP6UMJ5_9FLAO
MQLSLLCRSIFCILFLIFLSSCEADAQPANFGNISYAEAINISGRQRMLTQKTAKLYLMMVSGVANPELKKDLTANIALFTKQLNLLSENAKSNVIKSSLNQVSEHWKEYEALLISHPNLKNAELLLEKNTPLLQLCDQVVTNIEQNFKNPKTKANQFEDLLHIINISGKQRMLSQRFCLYYLGMTLFDNKSEQYKLLLRQIFEEFETTIFTLLNSPYNDDIVRADIMKLLYFWEKIKSDQNLLYNSKFEIERIYNTTTRLTDTFDNLTAIYEEIYKARQKM